MGAIVWPDEVLAYLVRTGRDPKVSCPPIERRAVEQARAIFNTLPGIRPGSILDIGCGLGMLDVFLAKSLEVVPARDQQLENIVLVDGDGSGPHGSRFLEDQAPWADVEVGAEVVRANVRAHVAVSTLLARLDMSFPPVDLVISSRSWGHHYPIGVYAAAVKRCLNPGGHLVLDIRDQTDGVHQLERAGFQLYGRVADPSVKCHRLVFRHRG